MDGTTKDRQFSFNEALSLLFTCKEQTEIDYYWQALTQNGGEESMCGWLKDKYGVSWQVAPEKFKELLKNPGAWQKMMAMKKIVIAGTRET